MRHMTARLAREIPVQLVDLSLSGCLVASDQPLDEGTIGELRVTLDGKLYQDTVQIRRTTRRHGTNLDHLAAAQFAWGNRSGTASIRGTVPLIVPRCEDHTMTEN